MFCASGGQAEGSDEDPRAGGREHLGVGEELGLPEVVEPGSEGWYAGCPRSTDGPAPSLLCIRNRQEGSNQCTKSFSSWNLASRDIGVGCISPSVTLWPTLLSTLHMTSFSFKKVQVHTELGVGWIFGISAFVACNPKGRMSSVFQCPVLGCPEELPVTTAPLWAHLAADDWGEQNSQKFMVCKSRLCPTLGLNTERPDSLFRFVSGNSLSSMSRSISEIIANIQEARRAQHPLSQG